ncbi:glycoside hydrolase family 65 protein [Phycicoccus endophyticus]|uniref:Glycoside hydrolase family 65 protein n=1 Tax=Phycicoccus endophyticus TaxID=1690220 RepID=A0A7G9QYI5_9MICO|nr:glycoside hydrolase family 65 protein [Phycicoccus endophyticus]NHI19310.1 glycoside hydrolase family 65 protein [Phycicoccus endophyticus]QNN48410.1 glycoside hydrolase family 65 protein [Phycicoccus endophyticus]GGL41750.1 kojibiose phosphorylase [Phycicoccus endophyticus]
MRTAPVGPDPLDRTRFPTDPWRLVETVPDDRDLGVTETLFTVANGYIGMRDNPEEGREVHEHGSFVNGFHETWPIRHAEAAYGFARTGQTMVNVPDAKLMKVYVDDEPLVIGLSDLEHYERELDLRAGVRRRSLVWRTPSGKRVRVDSSRMVSMAERHLAVLAIEVTMLDGDAPVVISSQLLNRQDGEDEYHEPAQSKVATVDPRKAGSFDGRVLMPRLHSAREQRLALGYQCAHSGMTVTAMADHRVDIADPYEVITRAEDDLAKAVFRVEARRGHPVRVEKLVAYHTSRSLPVRELADRCERTLDRAGRHGLAEHHARQREWFDAFWAASDVEVDTGDDHSDAVQQAVRFNLFSLAQAAARADRQGIPAKGVSGSGYEGHYFWDSEIYVAPFLTYTLPSAARNLLQSRSLMLPAAQDRAREMSQRGALFPWRTINGEEASAYYAAGTAQVHIDADIAHALAVYHAATDDTDFLVRHGLPILIETARLYADLGFWRSNGTPSFHIHGVTGPDEYTTVVNNNLFTNVMARFNLEQAALGVERVRREHPQEWARLARRLEITDDEVSEWRACAAGMHIPFDEGLEIHPQDDFFLDREVWDLSRTPASLRPLLLHYHPLVIYRFQVLKQADVVLALYLQGDRFTAEQKRKDFEYYDPITTGDSTLSAVVQSVVAAEVGYHEQALRYFHEALYVDLANLHDNTVDGLHVASAGGVWAALVGGFGGMRDHGGTLQLDPRLPEDWGSLTFRLTWRGTRVRFHLTEAELAMEVEDGVGEVPVTVRGEELVLTPGAPVAVPLPDQGARLDGLLGKRPQTGGTRADGSRITAGVPDPMPAEELEQPDHLVLDSRS